MSFLYPRTIAVHRLNTVAGPTDSVIGLTGYSGAVQGGSGTQGETVMFSGIPAKIQAAATGRKKDSSLPQDAVFAPSWWIFTPAFALAQYSVRDRDVIADDESYRYQVGQAEWSPLGYKLTCIRLEA